MDNNIGTDPGQQPLAPQNSPHFSKTFIILMVIVMVVAVGIGGYMVGANQSQIAQPPSQSLPPVTQPSPTPTQDETANWKTYRSSRCEFEISYPSEWKLDDASNKQEKENSAYQLGGVSIEAPNFKRVLEANTGMNIFITRTKLGTTSPRGFIINSVDDYIKSVESHPYSEGAAYNKQDKNYGSLSGKYFELNAFGKSASFVIVKNNDLYALSWPKKDDDPYINSINQILSTFKFTP